MQGSCNRVLEAPCRQGAAGRAAPGARRHRAVRARLRPHARQRAAARAAVVHARRRAITEVEIDGVLHEYTSDRGRAGRRGRHPAQPEGVALRMHTRDGAELRLHKKGQGPVTAGDIQTDHDVEIVNPELVIANLTKAGELTMTAQGRARPRLSAGGAARGVRGADARPSAACSSTPRSRRCAA